MKILKIIGSVALIILLLIFAIDVYLIKIYKDPVISTLPEYKDKICFEGSTSKGFTDYSKYFYDEEIDFSSNGYFKKVEEKDIEIIKGYYEVYDEFAKKEYFYSDFSFNMDLVDTDDFYFIVNKLNKESYKSYKENYDAFDIYFFDVQSLTLHFMHSNI